MNANLFELKRAEAAKRTAKQSTEEMGKLLHTARIRFDEATRAQALAINEYWDSFSAYMDIGDAVKQEFIRRGIINNKGVENE